MEFSFLSHVERPQYTDTQPAFHDCYEIVYYIKGTGYTVIDGYEFRYHPGTYALIPPYTRHEEKRLADSELVFAGFHIPDPSVVLEKGLFSDPDKSIHYIMVKMEREFTKQSPFYGRYLNILCEQIVLRCLRRQQADKDNPIQTAITYINIHFNKTVSLQALASRTGYSYHRFRHIFKEQTGLSPAEYILEKRLMCARMYLMNTSLHIAQIAQNCGFSSLSQFSKLFKARVGFSPREYRKFKEWKEVQTPALDDVL